MMNRYLIADDSVKNIEKQGCCLGKYRVLLSEGYYCFLEGVFACPNQDKVYVKNINAFMFACKTNNQLPCEQCEKYKDSQDKLIDEVKTIMAAKQLSELSKVDEET